MWGLMAQGCAGNGAMVGEEMVTRRPWAVEVVTVTDADTSTSTAAGSDGADGARITTPTEDTLRGSELAQDERQRRRQTVGMAERIQSAQRTQSASAGTTHRTA